MDLPLTDPGLTFLVLFAAILGGPLVARRVGAPALVGLIVAGLLIGPTGLHLVAREGLVDTLGHVGLLLLMFTAGTDLDLDGFAQRRRTSMLLGLASWVLPSIAVGFVALRFGLSGPAALLLASALASHTLLTLPDVRRAGHHEHPAVTVTLGATLVVSVASLLTLAVAAFFATDPPVWSYARFAAQLLAFSLLVLVLLPRIARWMLTRLVHRREVRLTVLLTGMLGLSAVAGALDVEPIVGAFLAGVAFNRYVPSGSALADRLATFSDQLFVPLFLIATGMLVDVRILTDLDTLALAAALTGAMVATKTLAAVVVGVPARWSPAEMLLSSGLSTGQAAGALAAVLVGRDLGVLDPFHVNAVVLVIVAAVVTTSAMTQRALTLLPHHAAASRPAGRRVIVPVGQPSSQPLLVELAAAVALADGGLVVPVAVVSPPGTYDDIAAARLRVEAAELDASAAGAEAHGQVRIGADVAATVVNTFAEQSGTCLVVGWKGSSHTRMRRFGRVTDTLVERISGPTLVCHAHQGLASLGEVVVVLAGTDPAAGPLASKVAAALADRLRLPCRALELPAGQERDAVVRTSSSSLLVIAAADDVDRRRLVRAATSRAAVLVLMEHPES